MGNVASWSGSKTLSYFQYYDQALADFVNPGQSSAGFSSVVSLNFATARNTSRGPTIDAPTTRGPFRNIQNDGQREFYFDTQSFKTT